jgi:hypothetical protein
LNLNFGHFHGAEGNISEELSRGRTQQPDDTSVLHRSLLTGDVSIQVLEDLVETELEETLHGVTIEGGEPTLPDGSRSLLSHDELDGLDKTSIFGTIHLHVTFGHIKRSYGSMSQTTGEDTSNHALGIVAHCVGRVVRHSSAPFFLRGGGQNRRLGRRDKRRGKHVSGESESRDTGRKIHGSQNTIWIRIQR